MKNQTTIKQKQSRKNIIQIVALILIILAFLYGVISVIKPMIDNSSEISESLLGLNEELFIRKNYNYYSSDFIKEKENNNKSKKANTIRVNKKYKGKLSSKKDEDWYYFEIPNSKEVSVRISYRYQWFPGTYYGIYLYGKEDLKKPIASYATHGHYLGAHDEVELDEGGYYLKIGVDHIYTNSPYVICIEY